MFSERVRKISEPGRKCSADTVGVAKWPGGERRTGGRGGWYLFFEA